MASTEEGKEDEPPTFGEAIHESVAHLAKGLAIVSMSIRDASEPQVLWQDTTWDAATMWSEEHTACLPATILECAAVARTIEFSSSEPIEDLNLVQRMLLHDCEVERFSYRFGFVIPGSHNTWEQTIVAADAAEMIPATVLSGNLVVESTFFSAANPIGTTRVRIKYV